MNKVVTLEDIKKQKELVIELWKQHIYLRENKIYTWDARRLEDTLNSEERHLAKMVLECSEL